MNVRSKLGIAISVAAFAAACGGTASPSEEVEQGVSTQALEPELGANFCSDLLGTISKLRTEIQKCNPAGSFEQCGTVVQDVCCPISAAGGPIKEFEEAVTTYREKCSRACTQQVCPDPSRGVCGFDGQCRP